MELPARAMGNLFTTSSQVLARKHYPRRLSSSQQNKWQNLMGFSISGASLRFPVFW